MSKLYQIKISDKIVPPPNPQEISAAQIIMQYLQTNIHFVQRSPLKTADLKIDGKFWEIKSPIGDGKRTIQNNLRDASHQSANIIVDLRRCKMPTANAMARIRHEMSKSCSIRKLLIITRDNKVIDYK